MGIRKSLLYSRLFNDLNGAKRGENRLLPLFKAVSKLLNDETIRKMPIPTEKEILDFLANNNFVNFSKLARKFRIKRYAIPDILAPLVKKKLLFVEGIGSHKFVRLKK